jgi:SAM-dependent methyltransferase
MKLSLKEKMQSKCQLCGFHGPMEPQYPSLKIVRCPSCQLVFYSPEIDPEPLYGEGYFLGDEYLNYLRDKPVLQVNFSRYIRHLRRWSNGGRLLEIGCAYGFFLEMAQRYWEVKGYDISKEGIAHAQKIFGPAVQWGDFLKVGDENESFDVVCLWDTLEHLNYPVKTLAKAAHVLNPGGILALTTGDIGSLIARWRGERWRLIHPPTHLTYFSKETLEKAIRSIGLELIEVSYVGYHRSYSAMLYRLFSLTGKKWIYRLLTFGERLDFPVYTNLFDILFVVARKPK